MTVQSSGATYQDILKLSLEQEGYTGTLDDMLYSKLRAITSEEGTVQDLMMKYLASIGFDSGAVQDRLKNYLEFFGYTGTNPDMLLTAVKNGVFLDAPVFSSDLYLDYNRQLYTASSLTGQELLSFSPLHTFTRASDKTYFDQNGDLQVAGPNVPVFDYDPVTQKFGLSVHTASTNLFLNSATPATQSITLTAAAHTLSFYGTGEIVLSGAATGTLTGTGEKELVTLTFTPTAGSVTFTLTGDVQYPQVEALAFASPYIITNEIATARDFDFVTIPDIDSNDWWNPTEGTFVFEWNATRVNLGTVFEINNGSTNNRFFIRYGASLNQWRFGAIINGSSTLTNIGSNLDINKVAFTVESNQIKFSTNGGPVVTISAPDLSLMTTFQIGTNTSGTAFLNGTIPKIKYIQKALSNAELITESSL